MCRQDLDPLAVCWGHQTAAGASDALSVERTSPGHTPAADHSLYSDQRSVPGGTTLPGLLNFSALFTVLFD